MQPFDFILRKVHPRKEIESHYKKPFSCELTKV